MECPICKSERGVSVVTGSCVECGYDPKLKDFTEIKINTSLLKLFVSEKDFQYLRETHRRNHIDKFAPFDGTFYGLR